jgi:hypothetical protein
VRSNPSLHLTFASPLRGLAPAGELKLQGLPHLSSKYFPHEPRSGQSIFGSFVLRGRGTRVKVRGIEVVEVNDRRSSRGGCRRHRRVRRRGG